MSSTRPVQPQDRFRWPARLRRDAAVAAAYLALAAWPALLVKGASPFWPPAAVAVLAALWWGSSAMGAVFVAALVANTVLFHLGLPCALLAAAGNSTAPLLGRAVLRGLRIEPRQWWRSPRGALAYLLGMGVVQALASALVGVGALALCNGVRGAAAGAALLGWTLADAGAAVLLAPALQLLWQRRGDLRALSAQIAQIAGVAVLTLLVWALVFGSHELSIVYRLGFAGLLLLPPLWSLLALDMLVSIALQAVTYLLVITTVMLHPPLLGHVPLARQVSGMTLFLLIVGGGGLLAAVLQAERRAALQQLRELHDELDSRATRRARALLTQERSHRAQIIKLSEFRRVISGVNRVIAQAQDEQGLLQTFCALIVGLPDLALAWIGRPDDSLRFQFLASAGPARGYLDELVISADPALEEGRGPAGRVWRGEVAAFGDIPDTAHAAPWTQRARTFGFRGTATLPLLRGGRIWAVFTLYATSADAFDADWRELALQLVGDISHGLDRVDALQRERQTLRFNAALLDNISVGVAVVRYPQRHLEHVNARLLQIAGARDLAQFQAHDVEAAYPDPDVRARVRDLAARVLRDGRGALDDMAYRRCDGATVWLDTAGVLLDLGDGVQRVLWTQVDVSRRHALNDELGRMAMYDPLTGLPNRRAIERRLARAIERAGRHGTQLAVGMLDLDDFKPVNDRWGHAAGDALLQQIAARLTERMRGSDLLGRLGGDEFVVVFEDLDATRLLPQLGAMLERLHGALDAAFEVGPGNLVHVGMSMGLALYPTDAQDADALLRVADVAMYHAKVNKSTRSRWWNLGTVAAEPPREAPFNAFGAEATLNLHALGHALDSIADAFAHDFYARIGQEPDSAPILASLSESEHEHLRRTQVAHLHFLLHPETTAAAIAARGAEVGRVHALTGVSSAAISSAIAVYRELLRLQMDAMNMPARVRYRTLRAIEERLQIDMQAELDAMQRVVNEYNGCLARPAVPPGAWVEGAHDELEALGALPGMLAAMLMRPRVNGVFTPELGSGPLAAQVAQLLSGEALQPTLNAALPTGNGLARAAWVSGEIERIDAYGTDPHSLPWASELCPLGVRSAAAIPVLGQRSEFILVLLGAWRSQFRAGWMRTFLMSLQNRWLGIAHRPGATPAALDMADVVAYREMLYADRLQMYVQPIVDLVDGSVSKVEALSRLLRDDGSVVSPGQFLPALREADLDTLFRSGLAQTLARLRAWRDAGLDIALSVNLPPSTLVHPDCARWVEEALRRERIAPAQLTLELVESQEFDEHRRDEAIDALVRLGVRLSIDDLGAGYSSLLRLASLPFDVIKVDQGITREILRSPIKILSLIRTIVQIGTDFDREVVVEGVESTAVAEAVAVLGARYVQGYVVARPMPAADFTAWLGQGPRLRLRDGALHSWLGALAYQWYYLHAEQGHYPLGFDDCPLTALLRAGGHAEAARWHALVHASAPSPQRRDAQQRLQDWLLQRVSDAPAG